MTGYSLEPEAYAREQLEAMTIAEIKALAESLGYSLTATVKADIIAEFLEAQGGEAHDPE